MTIVMESFRFISWRPLMFLPNSMAILQSSTVVELFQSGMKVVDRPADQHCHPKSQAASVAKNANNT